MHNFKKVLRTTLLFLLVFSLLTTGLIEFYYHGEAYYWQDNAERDEAAGTIDCLILGASRAKRGINCAIVDEELGVNSYNYSSPSMTMEARFDLLQKEISRNPVKTVILELSPDAIRQGSGKYDFEGNLYYLSRLESPEERFAYTKANFAVKDYPSVFGYCIYSGVDCFFRLLAGHYLTRQNPAYSYKGYKSYKEGPNDVSVNYEEAYHTESLNTDLNEAHAKELEQIVDYCKEKDIEVILVSVITSEALVCKTEGLQFYHDWYTSFAESKGLAYYDFNALTDRSSLFNDCTSFYDEQHLYGEAADVFTECFCDVIRRAESGEDVSSLFADSYEIYGNSH